MKQAQTPCKRMVGRGEYAWLQGKTFGVFLCGLGLWLAACLCGVATLGVGGVDLFLLVYGAVEVSNHSLTPAYLAAVGGLFVLFSLLGALTCALGKWACVRIEYDGTQDVMVLTRANVADLPANDSLVRASQEPMQAQEAVLLRAAAETRDGDGEQLLRAAAGG